MGLGPVSTSSTRLNFRLRKSLFRRSLALAPVSAVYTDYSNARTEFVFSLANFFYHMLGSDSSIIIRVLQPLFKYQYVWCG